MEELIQSLTKIPLYVDEVKDLCHGQLDFITYSDLGKIKNIDTLFKKFRCCLLLYQTSETFGHYCLISKINNHLIEFFDPYSGFPDSELDISNQMGFPKYLSRLIIQSPYKVIYNKSFKLQSLKNNINTCGYWCACRANMIDIPLSKWFNLFHGLSNVSPDWLVSAFAFYLHPLGRRVV